MTRLKTILDEIDDYLDQRADSEDGSYGVPETDEAMRLRDALCAAQADAEARYAGLAEAVEDVNEIARAYHDAEDTVTYATRDAIARLDTALAKVRGDG